jgi:hypothetical protein
VSLWTAKAHEKGGWLAGQLWEWVKAYILDWNDPPLNIYGTWNSSVLEDGDFKTELLLHLKSIGKYVRAMDIVDYVKKPGVLVRLKLKKPISLTIASVGWNMLATSGQRHHQGSLLMGTRGVM